MTKQWASIWIERALVAAATRGGSTRMEELLAEYNFSMESRADALEAAIGAQCPLCVGALINAGTPLTYTEALRVASMAGNGVGRYDQIADLVMRRPACMSPSAHMDAADVILDSHNPRLSALRVALASSRSLIDEVAKLQAVGNG